MVEINNDQFMPITHLMDLEAGDFNGRAVNGVFEHEYSQRHTEEDHYDWDALRKDMGKRQAAGKVSIKNPLAVGKHPTGDYLLNGHHRAMLAIEQGHLFVPVRNDIAKIRTEDRDRKYRLGR